jgi:ADP-ribose pyrophosphatase YjhB (NUDIX family)
MKIKNPISILFIRVFQKVFQRTTKRYICPPILQKIMSNINLKVRLILYNKGSILLLRQKKNLGGNYTLVGGTIETTEYALQALIRETKEEAGIDLKEKDLQLAHVLHKRTNGNGHRITLYFKASKWEGKLTTGEPNKFKGVAWFSLDNLPPNLSETVRHVLKEYREGRTYSEFRK